METTQTAEVIDEKGQYYSHPPATGETQVAEVVMATDVTVENQAPLPPPPPTVSQTLLGHDAPMATMMNSAVPEEEGGQPQNFVTAPTGGENLPPPTKIPLAERVNHMKETLGLPDQYVQDLLKLVGTDIVVIADDSGSMNAITDPRKITEPVTRWEELQQTLRMLVTMLLVVEHDEGFWLKFLNDPEWYKITDKDQLERIFTAKPRAHGKTPLKANLEYLMKGYGSDEKDTLLLILTDGEPSDCSFEELSQIIRNKNDDVYCSFAMCTDETNVVDRYNQVVDPIKGCDITDDYASERSEAIRFGNKLSPYQWLAKMLLVKFPHYDQLDERRLGPRSCCNLS
mmetsp:Transcript_13254/g.17688  ORF Transcript_13254/g.17688 Transcript_13254/m.17688 type:complete len:342 (+) Transcript_13254:20-1045(+)|eukprot:CAMPEP_0197321556 /NCGR_PEP_ID=MMETSP0891-20130614/65278_1 /TAXON_ID=44058 ORGANISM="Aureoumbra lagunensis, Strain CCMP1510" /NCGR_SAMPLE_ID=MMETSP0891 /ASSEMBLY_ACC=CAM_ASM_000534 /LENGTH=341 /DNA_ID=CAMNT_0042813485 /DNA_START=55 /DNA_END=1080 /DNA_ORIENTATION=+